MVWQDMVLVLNHLVSGSGVLTGLVLDYCYHKPEKEKSFNDFGIYKAEKKLHPRMLAKLDHTTQNLIS